MNERERRIRQKLKDDFEHYSSKCLWIRTKSGSIERLILNRAQRFVHDRLQDQLAETGRVRALVLKGRQQGCSTYIGGRFYHKTTYRKGWRTFILTHEDPATQNLYEMVRRYHEHCPVPVKPSTGIANAKELVFDKLDSGYRVGTAKTKGTGRSSTIQCFHGSEVAWWPNADTHAAGIMQAIPDAPGTEVVLESTANGMGNYYHQCWQDAESGRSGFQAIFVAWYWQEEYRKPVRKGFTLGSDDEVYMSTYGLDLEQMQWRLDKLIELKDPLLFKQEYPATPTEAFQVTGEETFVKAEPIMRARKYSLVHPHGVVVAGYDPDAGGKDGASSIYRQGRVAFNLERYHGIDAMGHVGKCRVILEGHKHKDGIGVARPYVSMLFIDSSADGVISRLREQGYTDRIRAVAFGGKANREEKYSNKRNEIWGDMDEWLNADLQVDIPDDDNLHADLMGPRFRYDSNHNRVLESKESMRNRGVRSPNDADALALTFAEPVAEPQGPTGREAQTVDDSPLYWKN